MTWEVVEQGTGASCCSIVMLLVYFGVSYEFSRGLVLFFCILSALSSFI